VNKAVPLPINDARRQQAINLLVKGEQAAQDRTQATNLDHGYQLITSACFADPSYGHAFYAAGCATSDLQRPHAAAAIFRRALEAEVDADELPKLLTNLAWELHKVGRQVETIEHCHRAIELNPKLSLPWMILGLVHTILGQTKTAVECARKCVDLGPPGDVTAEFQLAFALLFDGQYALGLKHFESRFAARLPNFTMYPYPKWRGENDKTLFLVADQGLGDTLSYSRFVEQAARRCRHISMCVQSELRRVFEHAFRHMDNLHFLPSPSNFPPDADCWSTFVSLPYALGLTDDEIRNAPNIDMPKFSMSSHWRVPDRKCHIGIAWSGSPMNDIDKHRNIPIHHFLELLRVPGIQLYSLQVDAKKSDLNLWGCAPVIRDLSGYIRDVADTTSILQNLDLVITVESALGHICSISNRECWVGYSYLGRDYRAGVSGADGQRLWTPKSRFFQQSDDMRWEPVFERIVEALREKVDAVQG